ncbi:MAG: hypothetical protein H6719_15125 [Sandaracinaceae bacterium]|nr:hypothetical protein [Sandaracinaceae bacterium]
MTAAVVVVSCGPSAADMMLDAMVATEDATMSDASAQMSCATNCSTGGALRVMTADSDASRLVRGGAVLNPRRPTSGESPLLVEVVAGPFVLTDARMSTYTGLSSDLTQATLWIAPRSTGCSPKPSLLDPDVIGNLYAPSGPDAEERRLEGARYFVSVSEVLCAEGVGVVAWAGFLPYD